jgi:hypothetical protein
MKLVASAGVFKAVIAIHKIGNKKSKDSKINTR